MELNPRQEEILDLVIENFIATAEPVGSRFLLSENGLDCGEATIRNELHVLEEAGFLTHPHTSSGRVPTAKGYEYYLRKINWSKLKLHKKDEDVLNTFRHADVDEEARVKRAARAAAELSGQVVIVAFSPDKIYFTGLSNIFSQPEFRDLNLVERVSEILDQCEERLTGFLERLSAEPECFVGEDQPFGEVLSLVAARRPESMAKAVIILGPSRMDYRRNYTLIKKFIDTI